MHHHPIKHQNISRFLLVTQCTVTGEACWWTVHPASKQRSEGEKVRVGDDVIFVSVATERYLVSVAPRCKALRSQINGNNSLQQATKENSQAIVNASFHVTQWNVSPFGTGLSRLKNQQCVFGGDVLRSVASIRPPY